MGSNPTSSKKKNKKAKQKNQQKKQSTALSVTKKAEEHTIVVSNDTNETKADCAVAISENTLPAVTHTNHIFTLHVSRKGNTKTIGFKKNHAIAAGVAAVLVLGGITYTGVSYYKTQNQLQQSQQQLRQAENENVQLTEETQQLKTENEQYAQNMNAIQQKATELEDKMTELEHTKQNLAEEINKMATTDTSSAEMLAILEHETAQPEKTFTNIVATSYNKSAALYDQLDKMDEMLTTAEVSFAGVATDVTETLAQHSSVPSGLPVGGVVTTEFNPTGDGGRVHKGMDISTRKQIRPITATASGTVIFSGNDGNGYGNYVKINHGNGFVTLYGHNSENLVQAGDKVKKGDVIAMSGSTGMSTGIHCHYEILLNGVYQNPRDYQ